MKITDSKSLRIVLLGMTLSSCLAAGAQTKVNKFDLNGDGKCDISDLTVMVNHLMGKDRVAPSCAFADENAAVSPGKTITRKVTTESDGVPVYSTSDPAVATVDASTGVVTGVKVGTCTITATLPATEFYLEATASYQLTVTSGGGMDPGGSISGGKDE